MADVTLLDPYNPKSFRSGKLSILDVKAVGTTGKRFNTEIQITDESDYDKRALYYWAKLYIDQLKGSHNNSTLHKAIGSHILHFISITDNKKYHNTFHITEKRGLRYFTDLELHTIELVKFSKDPKETIETLLQKIRNSQDIWTAFLNRDDLLVVLLSLSYLHSLPVCILITHTGDLVCHVSSLSLSLLSDKH